MNKDSTSVFLPMLLAAIMLALLLSFASSTSSLARQPHAATPSPVHTTPGARATASVTAPAPTPADRTVPGSTNGIVIMSFVIAFIIVLPILLQKSLWGK